VQVRDRDGRTWRVGRRWLPWRRRVREVPDFDFGWDLPDLGGLADDLPGFLVGLLIGLAVIIALPFVLLALGFLLEVSLLLALLPVAVLVRVALRRPWTVQVIAPDDSLASAEPVVGWRESGERVAARASTLREHRSEAGAVAPGEGTAGGGTDGEGAEAG
jgi:hypothetical protein